MTRQVTAKETYSLWQYSHKFLTPWSRLVIKRPISSRYHTQLAVKCATCHGTRSFITVLTTARHYTLL
jgi:hypothetical protein